MLGVTTQKHSPAVKRTVREEKEKDYMMVYANILIKEMVISACRSSFSESLAVPLNDYLSWSKH